jgi:hypothetical protein
MRLNPMAKCPGEVLERCAHVARPARMSVLQLKPRQDGGELVGGWNQGHAVADVDASVAQGEELRPKKIETPEGFEDQRPAIERRLKVRPPVLRKLLREQGGSVVEPVVAEGFTLAPRIGGEASGGRQDLRRKVGVEDVAALCGASNHAEQVEGGSSDHYRLEPQAALLEVGIECLRCLARLTVSV